MSLCSAIVLNPASWSASSVADGGIETLRVRGPPAGRKESVFADLVILKQITNPVCPCLPPFSGEGAELDC